MDFDENKLELLLDGNRGIYIPQIFMEAYGSYVKTFCEQEGRNFEQLEKDLSSPDNEQYWDTWTDLTCYWDFYMINENGDKFAIEQHDDLWAYPYDMEIPEDHFA